MAFKNTTLQDIAAKANVSKSTVSRVLNDKSVVNSETRRVVLEAMERVGYTPNVFAQGLAKGRSMTVGVVTQKIGSPFYDAIMQGVIEGFGGTGYSPLFADGQWVVAAAVDAVRTLLGRQVDGLILLGCDLGETEMNALRDRLPVIVVGREIAGWEERCVFIDNVKAAYEATKHLIDFGHRRIALVRGLDDHQDSIRRFEGYRQALSEAGIEFDENLTYAGDFSAQSGMLAVNTWLMRGSHFSAVFCANDMVAIGVRLALHRHGIRVPEDVSIIGFDDQGESAFLTPPLTTVRQPAVEMGRVSAEALVALMNDETFKIPALKAQLVRRETVVKHP
jgi:LacI family transcriptional regulator